MASAKGTIPPSLVPMLWPFAALLAADAVLLALYCPPGTSHLIHLEMIGHWFLHAAALLAFLSGAGACAAMVVWRSGEDPARRDNRPRKIAYAACIALLYALLDTLYGQSTYTMHYSQWLVRVPAAVAVVGILTAFGLDAPRWKNATRYMGILRLLVTLWGIAFCLAIGTSFHQFTTKHFREFGHAILVYPLILLWVVSILDTRRIRRRSAPLSCLVAFAVFILALTGVSYLSRSSAYLVETRLVGIPAMRRLNRELARVLLAGWNPPVAEHLVGLRRTHLYPPPVFHDIPCHTQGPRNVESVFVLSFDSLRGDYFGLSSLDLPNMQRLRKQSHSFTKAMSLNAVTRMTFYGLYTGVYPFTLAGPNNALTAVAKSLGATYQQMMEKWDAPKGAFTESIIATLDETLSAGDRFILHAHYLSLHPENNWAGSLFSYPEATKELDKQLGRIIDAFAERGLLDKTLFIFTADHGEELGDERGFQGHGFDVGQSIIHVPLMVRYPGGEYQQRDELVSTIDIFPTITEQLGVACDLPSHGRSLSQPGPANRIAFTSSAAPSPIYRYGRDLLFSDTHAVFVGDWKLIYNRGSNVWALFNLKHDPDEQKNQIDTFPGWANTLTELLDKYLAGTPPLEFSGSAGPSVDDV